MKHHLYLPTFLPVSFPDAMETFLEDMACLLYTSPSPRDAHESRMPSSA